ncbi:MAG: hypothetical protein ACRCV7_03045 [Culicoidibacterales bacterium]
MEMFIVLLILGNACWFLYTSTFRSKHKKSCSSCSSTSCNTCPIITESALKRHLETRKAPHHIQ